MITKELSQQWKKFKIGIIKMSNRPLSVALTFDDFFLNHKVLTYYQRTLI